MVPWNSVLFFINTVPRERGYDSLRFCKAVKFKNSKIVCQVKLVG